MAFSEALGASFSVGCVVQLKEERDRSPCLSMRAHAAQAAKATAGLHAPRGKRPHGAGASTTEGR